MTLTYKNDTAVQKAVSGEEPAAVATSKAKADINVEAPGHDEEEEMNQLWKSF